MSSESDKSEKSDNILPLYYQKHVFVCTNLKKSGKKCCEMGGGSEMAAYLKKELKNIDAYGEGKIRVSKAGCLGRCDLGPLLVIYPEGVWYHYDNQEDIDKILQQYLLGGKEVVSLKIYSDKP